MRKKIYYLLFIVISFFCVMNVYAEDYKLNTLIPVNTTASVETDKFDYKNFVYDTNVDAKGNATLKFEGIQNNTLSKTAVSINVLLFDENQKNIGFLTYCTDKDVSSDNSGFKIRANQVVPFTINVTKRYFVEGKEPKDVRYIAVRDENRYCQIGGYSNYKDLTLEEIINGKEEKKEGFSFPDLSSVINTTLIIVLFIIIAIIGIIFGLMKFLNNRKETKFTNNPVINKKIGDVETTINPVNEEANKPLDLDSFYNSSQEKSIIDSLESTTDISDNNSNDTNNNSNNTSIEDIFNTPAPAESKPLEEKTTTTDESTKANVIEDLYNSINDDEDDKKEDNSTTDLYNSINGSNDSVNGVSVDDLYESINSDDDDDDDDSDDDE